MVKEELELRQRVVDGLRRARDRETMPVVSELSDRANLVVWFARELRARDSNYQHIGVAMLQMVAVMVGDDPEKYIAEYRKDDDRSFPAAGTPLVLVSNPNSHDYPQERVIVVKGGDFGIKPNGSRGNHLPEDRSAWRLATDEEIELAVVNAQPGWMVAVESVLGS
jgi:hypothetical protein